MAAGGDDKIIRVYEIATGKLLQALSGHSESVRALAFTPDGKALASSGADGMLLIWNLTSGKEIWRHEVNKRSGPIFGISISPDGKRLASSEVGGTILLWDLEELRKEK